MKKLGALSYALLFPALAMGAVTVDMNINICGKTANGTMTFETDAQIYSGSYNDFTVYAKATPDMEDTVLVQMEMYLNDEQGQACLVAAPVVKASMDQAAELVLTGETGNSVTLQVMVTK